MIDTKADPTTNGELYNRVQNLRLDSVSTDVQKLRGGGGSWLPWILSFFLAISWTFIGVKYYKDAGNPKKTVVVAEAGTTPEAKTNTATSSSSGSAKSATSGSIILPLKGNLIPFQQISVSPIDVGGRCVELYVVEGKFFKKGEILAKIEDNSYRAQVMEAEANVASAVRKLESTKQRLAELNPKSVRKIEVEQVQAQLDESIASQFRAKQEFERLNAVSKDSTFSIRELQQAEADMRMANARVLQLKAALQILVEGPRIERLKGAEADVFTSEADVKVAEARLVQAKWRLDNCIIRSPIDGTVVKKIAELGNLVNPMAFSGGGGICDIANLADMEIDIDVPERDIEKVYVGQKAKVVPDAFKSREYEGTVDRIMPIADDSKAVIKIRVKVKLPEGETPGKYLKPKMSVVCSLLNDTK